MAGISINIAGNFTKLDELKDKAHKTASSIKGAFDSRLGKAMFAGVTVAATAAFAGVLASIKKAIDAGGELQDAMAKTGATGKGLLILQRAFENAGLAASDVAPALNRMQKALAGINEDGQPTNEAFAKLGLSVSDLMAMDPGAAFVRIGEKLAAIQNPAQRAAVAMELFGKSGGNLLAVFRDAGAFELAKTQLGGLADLLPGMAGDADAVGDAFGGLDTKLMQLGAGIASELMPNLLQVSNWLNDVDFTEAGTRIGMTTVKVSKAVEMLGKLAALTPAYQLGKAAEWVAFDGGNLTDLEKAETRAQSKAESDKYYQDNRDKAQPEAADKDPFAEPDVPKEVRDKAIREFDGELKKNRDHQDDIRKIDEEDAARKKEEADAKRKAAQDAKTSIQEVLAGKVNDSRAKLDALNYESSVGATGSMQRIGGGGGAVSSGLDYARQAADQLQEVNSNLRELITASRKDLDL